MSKKIMVGMSGGVDSSVAALLLQKEGYEVAGATFRLWEPGEASPVSGSIEDARAVCLSLNIPHYVLDFKDLFRERVVEAFAQSYEQGETPNPCVSCNRHIKFAAFWEAARAYGFQHIATGHYASVVFDRDKELYRLRMGASRQKDQSYFLYPLTQQLLSVTQMPLGALSKEEVRALAADAGLAVQSKKDSQDICFIPDRNYSAFLEAQGRGHFTPGSFIDRNGRVLGTHRGISRYTIGQRKGLGLSLPHPMFVAEIIPSTNTVVLAEDEALWAQELFATALNWIEPLLSSAPFEALVKIRYAHQPAKAQIHPLPDGTVLVRFAEPVRAVTPGQAVVFYQDEFVLGGGTIGKKRSL